MDYAEWIKFIDAHPSHFIWKENTEEGKKILNNIDDIPVNFRNRILKSLNKSVCYKEFDAKKGYYNIHFSFNFIKEYVNISFERKPKLEDLKALLYMANYLDAYLLLDGNKIIDEKVIGEL
ncbi:hypothetical protein [Capnocytophaga cynodegmi]